MFVEPFRPLSKDIPAHTNSALQHHLPPSRTPERQKPLRQQPQLHRDPSARLRAPRLPRPPRPEPGGARPAARARAPPARRRRRADLRERRAGPLGQQVRGAAVARPTATRQLPRQRGPQSTGDLFTYVLILKGVAPHWQFLKKNTIRNLEIKFTMKIIKIIIISHSYVYNSHIYHILTKDSEK